MDTSSRGTGSDAERPDLNSTSCFVYGRQLSGKILCQDITDRVVVQGANNDAVAISIEATVIETVTRE